MGKTNKYHQKTKYKQGIFNPLNSNKYIGKLPVIYRSSYELKIFRWCDNCNSVTKWGSESLSIPYYFSTNSNKKSRLHRYYPDVIMQLKTKDGSLKNIIVEIKPKIQTVSPIQGKKRKTTIIYEQYMYAKNMAKWDAAREWCKKNNIEFMIWTEEDIKKLGQ